MKTLGFSLLVLGIAATGCSFAVRAPANYRDDTQALLETRNPQIKACYDDALKVSKEQQGKVTVHFVVAKETGSLTNITAVPAGTTASEPLTKCVVNSLEGLQLQPPDEKDGDATFVYDFTVGPAPAPAG